MSQVNLLPPDILQAQRYRRLTSGVVVAGIVLVAAVFAYYLWQSNELSSVNDEIVAQEATNASIQASIAEKQKYADLQAEAQAQQQLLAAAYAGEVSFSALLMDFSRVIPSDAYVNSLAVQADQAAVAAEGATPGLIGGITGSGQAVSIDTLSVFLTRLEQVKGWVNPWMSTVSKNEEVNGYDYSVSVDLTDEVVTERGKEGAVDAAG
ncbi:MAG TPA: PilN domain-containing protein [Actinomycetota bacterium]|nr:PilN domain-containing protein [Actinomycetota bacterium]